jgi:cell division protein FtsL
VLNLDPPHRRAASNDKIKQCNLKDEAKSLKTVHMELFQLEKVLHITFSMFLIIISILTVMRNRSKYNTNKYF